MARGVGVGRRQGGPSSHVRCVFGLVGLAHSLIHSRFDVCMCVFLYPSAPLSHSRMLKAKGWLSGRRETRSNKPLISLAKPRALSRPTLFLSGQAFLPDRVVIRACSGVCISRPRHCKWLTRLHTPTSIWTQRGKKGPVNRITRSRQIQTDMLGNDVEQKEIKI